LQRALNEWGGPLVLKVDGDFGALTASKVERFQTNRQLGTDGVVDAVMWAAIHRQPMPALHPQKPETRKDKQRRLRVEMLDRIKQRAALKPGTRRNRIIARQRKLARALKELAQPDRPRLVGPNKVRGGLPGERVVFAARKALEAHNAGRRPSFYSQPGAWTVAYAITGEPRGFRSDCSQWVTSLFKTAGLPDPNGGGYVNGGYTGTLANHGRRISWSQAQEYVRKGTKPVLVIWDPWGPSGHVELLVSPAGDTIGHGSAPIAAHTVSTFAYKPGGARFYTY